MTTAGQVTHLAWTVPSVLPVCLSVPPSATCPAIPGDPVCVSVPAPALQWQAGLWEAQGDVWGWRGCAVSRVQQALLNGLSEKPEMCGGELRPRTASIELLGGT